MKVTILGSGPSSGVPQIGNIWGRCDPAEPRNRRRRASILVEEGGTTILVDTSPDCRQQLLDAGVDRLDAIIFTHAHADHMHGIDDLRWINVAMGAMIPAHADPLTLEQINNRFGYAFAPLDTAKGSHFYKPCLDPIPIDGPFRVGSLEIQPFRQDHGFSETTGLRIGRFAYSTDLMRLNEPAFEVLAGIDAWVIGCFGRQPHPTHAHVDLALDWIRHVGPERAWITHMGPDLDYRELCDELPEYVRPAYDGLMIDV